MPNQPEASIDYDRLMRANLASVFNERDAGTRIRAIGELYAESAVLYEPPDTAAEGHAAISEAVTRLLASLPPDFAFTATGPALGHHGIGRLRWQAGPPNGPVAVNGMDIARFQDGRIHSLHVFIEPTA
jgi:SnoaL-like domain